MNKEFTPKDIIWIKNVNNTELGQVYMDLSVGDEFVLHFPNQHKGNITSPQIGDIILIRQKINEISVFTHLVAPIEMDGVEENKRPNFSCGRKVQVIAITPVNSAIPASTTNWKGVFSRGNACKITKPDNFKTLGELQKDIWERFSPFMSKKKQKSA